MNTSDRAVVRVAVRADGEPLTEQVVDVLRERVRTRYYDRPEVIEAVARSLAARGIPPG